MFDRFLLRSIEVLVYENLNSLFEEVKVIFMNILDNQTYQRTYFRDSNGYIKEKPKL